VPKGSRGSIALRRGHVLYDPFRVPVVDWTFDWVGIVRHWVKFPPTTKRSPASGASADCQFKARGIYFPEPVRFFRTFFLDMSLYSVLKYIESEKAKPSARVGRKANGSRVWFAPTFTRKTAKPPDYGGFCFFNGKALTFFQQNRPYGDKKGDDNMKKKSLLNLLAALLVFIVLPILFASPAAADYTIDGMNFIDIGPTPGLFSQHGTFVNFSDMTGGQMDTLVSADPFVGGVVMGISNLSGTGSVSLILGSPSNHVVSAQCPAPVSVGLQYGTTAYWARGARLKPGVTSVVVFFSLVLSSFRIF
jgi:hypothetical protein